MLADYDPNDAPVGSRKIWVAEISGSIVRIKIKKVRKKGFYTIEKETEENDNFCFQQVYKDGEEENPDSYFIKYLRRILDLDKQKEILRITEIKKIKYLGYSIVAT